MREIGGRVKRCGRGGLIRFSGKKVSTKCRGIKILKRERVRKIRAWSIGKGKFSKLPVT